jgi:hypothetical protein
MHIYTYIGLYVHNPNPNRLDYIYRVLLELADLAKRSNDFDKVIYVNMIIYVYMIKRYKDMCEDTYVYKYAHTDVYTNIC